MQHGVVIRRAFATDIDAITQMVNRMARDQLMLARSKYKIATMLQSFFVAVDNSDQIVGCGSCSILWSDLAEVCSLVVDEEFQGRGVGKILVNALLDEARRLKIPQVIALTYQVKFFKKLGFTQTDKDAFPRKLWRECLECPKLEECDETAVYINL